MENQIVGNGCEKERFRLQYPASLEFLAQDGDVMLANLKGIGTQADNTRLILNEDSELKVENNKRQELLRFQIGIYGFQNGQHDVLCDDEFVEELIKYLFRLSRHGHREIVVRVLEKLGDYIYGGDSRNRDKSLYILSAFTKKINRDEKKEFANVISHLRVN